MKPLVAILVAALFVCVGADGYARPSAHAAATATKRTIKKEKRRARRRMRMTRPVSLTPSEDDELVLAPAQLQQLEHNLIDGGYMNGPVDGRMTHRVRRALAEFQLEYHMRGTGVLDRATAVALLGVDGVGNAPVAARLGPRHHRR